MWAKLTLLDIYVRVTQIPIHVRALGPNIFVKVNTP